MNPVGLGHTPNEPCRLALRYLLLVGAALTVAPCPTYAQLAGPDPFYGIHIGNDTDIERALPMLTDLGMQWTRVWIDVVDWTNPSAAGNDSPAFAKAIALHKAGFRVIALINSHGGTVPTESQARQYFAWIKTKTDLYEAVDIWEILNELNLSKYWGGTPQQYVSDVLKPAWEVLRGDTRPRILGGSFTAWQEGTWGTGITRAYTAAGYLDYCDYAGSHPYLERVSETRTHVADVLDAFGDKPVIITEWNFKLNAPVAGTDSAWCDALGKVRTFLYDEPRIVTACFYRLLAGGDSGYWPGLIRPGTSYVPQHPFYELFKCFPKRGRDGSAPPSAIALTSPANGDTIAADSGITLSAAAEGASHVAFYTNGATLIGVDSTGQDGWSLRWDDPAPGEQRLCALAFGSQGASVGSYGTSVFVRASSTGKIVSINFKGLAPAMVTGAAAGVVPSGQWNNVTNAGMATGLLDNRGENTGASIENDIPSNYASDADAVPGDALMMKGSIAHYGSGTRSITVRDLPPSVTEGGYDVYVYWSGKDATRRTVRYTLGDLTRYLTSQTAVWPGYHSESTAETEDASVAGHDYVVFSNLEATSFTLGVRSLSPYRGGVCGMQIVNGTVRPGLGTVALQVNEEPEGYFEGDRLTLVAILSGFAERPRAVVFMADEDTIGRVGEPGADTCTAVWEDAPAGRWRMRAIAVTPEGVRVGSPAVSVEVAAARGRSILSVNFEGNGPALAASHMAGAVPALNWNAIHENDTLSTVVLHDGSTVTGLSVRSDLPANYATFDDTATGDHRMMKGYSASWDGEAREVVIDGIPEAFRLDGYDLYVYWGNKDKESDLVSYSVGGDTYWLRDDTEVWNGIHARSDARDSSSATTGRTYVRFEGLTGEQLRLLVTSHGGFRTGVAGLQLVKSDASDARVRKLPPLGGRPPEPAAWVLYDLRGRRVMRPGDLRGASGGAGVYLRVPIGVRSGAVEPRLCGRPVRSR